MAEYIYESPDGGDTVYRREPSSMIRELHYQSERKQLELQKLQREDLWMEIIQSVDRDPVLNNMLEQVEIYYALKNTP